MDTCRCTTASMSTTLSKTCNCGIVHTVLLHSLDHGDLPLRNDKDVNDLDDELQLRNLHNFLRSQDHGQLTLYNNGSVTTLSKTCNCGIFHGVLMHSLDHGDLHLRNDKDVNSTTLSMNCNCEPPQFFFAIRTMGNTHCITTGKSTTLSKTCNCGTFHGVLMHSLDHGHMSMHKQRACQQRCPRKCKCKFGISTGFRTVAPVVAQQRAYQQPHPRPATAESPRGSARPGPWAPDSAVWSTSSKTVPSICQ